MSAHLEQVAGAVAELERELEDRAAGAPAAAGPTRVSEAAGEQVSRVIAAGEQLAAEIERAAREDAESVVSAAREEAEALREEARSEAAREESRAREQAAQTLEAAREDADRQLERARASIAGVAGEAEELQARMSDLGNRLAAELREQVDAWPEEDGGVAAAADHRSDHPTEEAAHEDEDPAGFLEEDESLAEDEELEAEDVLVVAPEEIEAGTEDDEGEPDDQDDQAESTPPPEPASDEHEAARLVAMNLALEGADEERIRAELVDTYGELDDLDELIDDVLARSGG